MNRTGLQLTLASYRFAIGLSLAVFLINFAYGILRDNAPVRGGDTAGYLSVAERIRARQFLQPSFRTPGYPLLLSLVGLQPSKKIVWVGLTLHALSTLLLVWLLRNIGTTLLSQISLAPIMCLPLYAQSAAILMTENLAEFSLVITFVLWFQSIRKCSLLFGISAEIAAAWSPLVRPAYQLLPVALPLVTIIYLALFAQSFLHFRRVLNAMSLSDACSHFSA